MRRFILKFVFRMALLVAVSSSAATLADGPDFETDVRPILQQRCFACHNDEDAEGDVSLQQKSAAFDAGIVVAGKPQESRLLQVVTSKDKSERMPKDADPLSLEDINTLRDWIKAGANWPDGAELNEPAVDRFDWWSYQPIERTVVPDVGRNWAINTVDAFVLNRMQQHGLTPSPQADRRTLIRRLTFDLTGLPPTPEEVRDFEADDDPEAYSELVDRLLASPRYGERWARHWLDVVKYADTCGYDKDKLRPNAWPYRDYVIEAFNEDRPYSRFVKEQIAADVLFPNNTAAIRGLGFLAAGPWDFIGHVEVPESKIDGKVARNLDRDDMVTNTLNTFCSVTVQCARCHNHKFDPVTQENYYSLQAVFAAVDKAERPHSIDPATQRRRKELLAKIKTHEAELAKVSQQVNKQTKGRMGQLTTEIASLQSKQNVQKAPEFGYHSHLAASPNEAKWVEAALPQPTTLNRIVLHACHDDFGGIGAGFGFPLRFRVEVRTADGSTQVVADNTANDFPNPLLRPVAIDCNVDEAVSVRIVATKLAERKNDFTFALAELELFDSDEANVGKAAAVSSLDSIEAPSRWSRKNLTDGKWARSASPDVARQLKAKQREQAALRNRKDIVELTQQRKQHTAAIVKARDALKTLPKPPMVYSAATQFSPQGNFKPTNGVLRPIHVLHRGDIQSPRDKVGPGVLPLTQDAQWRWDDSLNDGQRRAEMAKWLTDESNPLVWRSVVNRIWQYHFGNGIVSTPNDFGRMGSLPTHPLLLDWLADEFRRSQSFKSLHRLLVISQTYRQASAHDAGKHSIDGGNQYLWRMSRRRLEAEELRDSILSVSGIMNLKMGGPGFYTFEIEKPEHSPHFEYHKFDPADPMSHRRSIYRFVVRSQPDPWMTTLDCADSSQSTPRRNETLTSLQALSLLNSRFNLEMATRFAKRISTERESTSDQVRRAFELTLQREASPSEEERLTEYAKTHGLPNLCRLLFNLSEFTYVD